MTAQTIFVLSSFSTAENIGTGPLIILWLLPLTAAIVIIYKATKLPTITAGDFIKETAVLFGSIIVFMAITALALYVLARIVTE